MYTVEHNGRARAPTGPGRYDLAFGDGGPGLVEGRNVVRIMAQSGTWSGWSQPIELDVQPAGRLRTRDFDFEADGPMILTLAEAGTTFDVGGAFAWGGGKGARFASAGVSAGRCYRHFTHLPTDECWIRLLVQPVTAFSRIVLARIATLDGTSAEHLFWTPAQGFSTERLPGAVASPPGTWLQAQLGVRPDGAIELWTFDGDRERLVGVASNPGLAGAVKRVVSIGNSFETIGGYEVWIDHIAFATRRQPWVSADRQPVLRRPRPLAGSNLPSAFSFVFGSCVNPNHIPLDGTALAAAAAEEPDFFLHLGDHGYADTSAWAQNEAGYLAHWAGLMQTEHLQTLSPKPWVSLASDHDLGTNDATSVTFLPFANAAFSAWQANHPGADGVGRYGAVSFDRGRVLLIWTEGVAFRSPLGVDGSLLGEAQLAWLLNLLGSTSAGLVLLATQTTVGHLSGSGWAVNPSERGVLLAAAQACGAQVRFLSGDYHAARWARFSDRVAEWGASPMAEFPQAPPLRLPDVTDHGYFTVGNFTSRPEALAVLTLQEFNAATTYGRVGIDTGRHEATIALHDPGRSVRRDHLGRPMAETIAYGAGR